MPVCPDCQLRARRILQALAHAAHHHGFAIAAATDSSDVSVEITARETTFTLQFAVSRTEHYDTDSVQYPWQRVTARTTHPSHQLDLHLPYSWGNGGRRYRWGDRQRWRLEDKLPHLLTEIEHRAQRAEEARLARQRKEEDTRRRWHAAMDQARHDYLHARRLKALREQTETWHEATRIRAYCDALEEHARHTPVEVPEEDRQVAAWVSWARDHADRIDPVLQNTRGPEPPEHIAPEDLRPYLRGWNPYGPEDR